MTFTASNGVEVRPGRVAGLHIECAGGNRDGHDLSDSEADALREYFRAEDDKRFGRWRWPENPACVVYPRAERGSGGRRRVVAINEVSGFHYGVCVEGYTDEPAAVAYFDANPEPKPWHDAVPGQVWVVTEHGQPERAYLVDDTQFYDSARDYALNFDDSKITAARRIWPEEEN